MFPRIVVKITQFILTIMVLSGNMGQYQNQPQNDFDNPNIISDLSRPGYQEGYSGWDGDVWEHENAVYYLSVDNDIMKWTTENGAITLLENVSGIGGILVSEEWLYYFAYGKPIIYRVNLDNGFFEVFFNAEDIVGFSEILYDICGFTLYNGNLYKSLYILF